MRSPRMRSALVLAAIASAHCGGRDTTTAPTPVVNSPTPPVVVTPPSPPPVVPPPVVPSAPVPTFPPNDPRFDLTYYRQLVHNAYDTRVGLEPLRRQTQAPRIYLRTIDDAGRSIDAFTLDQTASALESVAGSLTGVFGLAGIERGTETRQGQRGWITVRWSGAEELRNDSSVCGRGAVGGDLLTLFPRSPGCRCPGGPAVMLETVKHELGHVLGFWHTADKNDLMYPVVRQCDTQPSEREKYHAAVAYSRPIGSPAP